MVASNTYSDPPMFPLLAVSGSSSELLDLDIGFMLAGLGQLIGHLHPQQRVGLDSKSLFTPDRHIGREARIAVPQGAQRLPRRNVAGLYA